MASVLMMPAASFQGVGIAVHSIVATLPAETACDACHRGATDERIERVFMTNASYVSASAITAVLVPGGLPPETPRVLSLGRPPEPLPGHRAC